MGEFRMPSLGADMEVGTILEWKVQPGDTVHRGDIIAVVDTEKSTIEVEVFEDGVVEALLIGTDVEVPVGTPLARLRSLAPVGEPRGAARETTTPAPPPVPGPAPTPAAPTSERPAPAARAARTKRASTRRSTAARPSVAAATPAFVRASPRVRREAASRGLDLATIVGSGPGGAVLSTDLPPPDTSPPPHPADRAGGPVTTSERQAAMRHAIGALMARSKREIPHYYLASTIDLGRALEWMTAQNADRPLADRLLPAALLLKATARAAHDVPSVNGFWSDGFQPSAAVHLGVAVSLRSGGLVAPAIHDADRLGIDELMTGLRDLVQRARSGTLRSSEMSDPTITVTNLGDQGVEEVFGVIHPPQVAMVGFGRVVDRPWAVDGLLGVRPVVRVTLAADHRASDGHDGARFLTALEQYLQSPADL